MKPETWPRIGLLSACMGALAACKMEPIEQLELEEHSAIELPDSVQPLSSELHGNDQSAARWDEALTRQLSFATGPALAGRHPGSAEAALTAGFVIAVWQAAGLSPSGPDLGWTQSVGVRQVQTQGLSLTIQRPADDEGKAVPPLRFDEGLWLQRHGSANSGTLRLRLEGQAELAPEALPTPSADPGTDPPPPPKRLRLLEPSAVAASASPLFGYREAFESAWRDGVDVAVLPIPGEDGATLAAAGRWRQPVLQSLLLGRDPPAALDLQGFVAADVYAALVDARATPAATVELAYEATERWFENDNVIGRLAGGRHPEQVVLVCTHWDQREPSEPSPEGSATDDNAGSLAVLLSLAEAAARWRSAGRRPERSIVFLAEAAGSLGHLGIARFIEASGIRPANIVAVVVLDQLGGTGSELLVVDGGRSTLAHEVNTLDPTARSIDAGDRQYGHAAFLELRVPAVTLTRPALPRADGKIPPPSVPALRRDAELTLRLLWALSDQAELPRLIIDEPPSPAPAP